MIGPRADRRLVAWIAGLAALVTVTVAVWLAQRAPEPTHAQQRTPVVDKVQPQARFIAVAGGATPDSNPISLEQNLALAHAVLPGPGVLFFGSGPSGATVQVLDPTLPRDPLLHALGELLAPRAGRDSRYQSTSLPAAAATTTAVRTELSVALARSGPPLLLYISAHGDRSDAPRDNTVQLWGGDGLSAVDLADLHDRARSQRALRVVITSCYSGGFAELAFAGADSERGASKKTRCGLFATTWDLESSGCDPNPDRAAQEGYSLHFFNALRGVGRDGQTAIDADYDDDGKVTLLEAHTRARIASESIDVPTTTSERFLRKHVTTIEDDTLSTPEESAVIRALSQSLSLTDEAAARTALENLEAQIAQADQRLVEAQDKSDGAYNKLVMELLTRWPVIDDPWHPLYAQTIEGERDAILKTLNEGEAALAYAETQRHLHAQDAEREVLEARHASHSRLVRAYDNQHMAATLKRQDEKAWSAYQQLLQCERGLP